MVILVIACSLGFAAFRHLHYDHRPYWQRISQLRVISISMVLFSQGNNDQYPGVMPDGLTVDPAVGLTAQGRIQKLINEKYLTLEATRSTHEKQTGTTSYAMLQINCLPDQKTIAPGGRNLEWRDNNNSKAPILSDRAISNSTSDPSIIKSIHTNPPTGQSDWRGTVVWNDIHLTFEATSILTTRYGNADHPADNLFASPGVAEHGDDAMMVWTGTDLP